MVKALKLKSAQEDVGKSRGHWAQASKALASGITVEALNSFSKELWPHA